MSGSWHCSGVNRDVAVLYTHHDKWIQPLWSPLVGGLVAIGRPVSGTVLGAVIRNTMYALLPNVRR